MTYDCNCDDVSVTLVMPRCSAQLMSLSHLSLHASAATVRYDGAKAQHCTRGHCLMYRLNCCTYHCTQISLQQRATRRSVCVGGGPIAATHGCMPLVLMAGTCQTGWTARGSCRCCHTVCWCCQLFHCAETKCRVRMGGYRVQHSVRARAGGENQSG